jgi:hypothetical protein
LKLQHYFRDGPFAERIRVPTENAISIGDSNARKPAAGAQSTPY